VITPGSYDPRDRRLVLTLDPMIPRDQRLVPTPDSMIRVIGVS
jgi:hypothetical protein